MLWGLFLKAEDSLSCSVLSIVTREFPWGVCLKGTLCYYRQDRGVVFSTFKRNVIPFASLLRESCKELLIDWKCNTLSINALRVISSVLKTISVLPSNKSSLWGVCLKGNSCYYRQDRGVVFSTFKRNVIILASLLRESCKELLIDWKCNTLSINALRVISF